MNLHQHFRNFENDFETILPILAYPREVISRNFSWFRLFLMVSEFPREVISRPGGFQRSIKLPNRTGKTRKKAKLVCNYEGLSEFFGVSIRRHNRSLYTIITP